MKPLSNEAAMGGVMGFMVGLRREIGFTALAIASFTQEACVIRS